jgi:hypothetical protein
LLCGASGIFYWCIPKIRKFCCPTNLSFWTQALLLMTHYFSCSLTLKRAYPYPSIFFMDFPITQELSNIMHSYFVLFIFYIDSNGLQSYELWL